MKSTLFKIMLPLVCAVIVTFIFFFFYNRFLLDKTLANLTLSFNKIEEIKDAKIADTVKNILDDTFIMEVAREEFDTETLARIEFSSQMVATVTQTASDAPIDDALSFLQAAIDGRQRKRSPFINALETLLVNLNPEQRAEQEQSIRRQIDSIQAGIATSSGPELQTKYLETARLCLLIKQWDEALAYLEKAVSVDATTIYAKKALFYKGLVHKFKGNLEMARDTFRDVKDDLPADLSSFCSFQEGDALYKMGKTEEAVEIFQQTFAAHPESPVNQIAQYRAGYTQLAAATAGDSLPQQEKAFSMFEEIVRKNPRSALGKDIGRTYRKRGMQLARRGYQALKRGEPDASSEYFMLGQKQFDLALQVDPQDALSHSGKALTLFFLDRKDAALKEAQLAKTLAPNDRMVLGNLGYLYSELRMFDNAIAEYKEIFKLKGDSAVLNYNMGTFYLAKGEFSESVKYYTKAQKVDADLPYVCNNLGYVYWRQQRINEARRQFERGASLQQDYVESHYNLGVINYVFRKNDEAKKEFDLVNSLRPGYRKTEWFLQQIMQKLSD